MGVDQRNEGLNLGEQRSGGMIQNVDRDPGSRINLYLDGESYLGGLLMILDGDENVKEDQSEVRVENHCAKLRVEEQGWSIAVRGSRYKDQG